MRITVVRHPMVIKSNGFAMVWFDISSLFALYKIISTNRKQEKTRDFGNCFLGLLKNKFRYKYNRAMSITDEMISNTMVTSVYYHMFCK